MTIVNRKYNNIDALMKSIYLKWSLAAPTSDADDSQELKSFLCLTVWRLTIRQLYKDLSIQINEWF